MLDTKDFNFFETQNSFDFKGFLLKIISYWKWFLLSLVIAFTIAYNVNIRKEKVFGMESLIVVEDQNNTLFNSKTSLIFMKNISINYQKGLIHFHYFKKQKKF